MARRQRWASVVATVVALVLTPLLAGCAGLAAEPSPVPSSLQQDLLGRWALVEVEGRRVGGGKLDPTITFHEDLTFAILSVHHQTLEEISITGTYTVVDGELVRLTCTSTCDDWIPLVDVFDAPTGVVEDELFIRLPFRQIGVSSIKGEPETRKVRRGVARMKFVRRT
jgi:hypothetical protein